MKTIGKAPVLVKKDLFIECDEYMFVLNMPISFPISNEIFLPDSLEFASTLIEECKKSEPLLFFQNFVYLTVKSLPVSGQNTGQRPGWHCDGFGTNDISFIWSNSNPTLFFSGEKFEISSDCLDSMFQMEQLANDHKELIHQSKPFELLKLDEKVCHKPMDEMPQGERFFIKLVLSKKLFNLKGNAKNPLLKDVFLLQPLKQRNPERNHQSA